LKKHDQTQTGSPYVGVVVRVELGTNAQGLMLDVSVAIHDCCGDRALLPMYIQIGRDPGEAQRFYNATGKYGVEHLDDFFGTKLLVFIEQYDGALRITAFDKAAKDAMNILPLPTQVHSKSQTARQESDAQADTEFDAILAKVLELIRSTGRDGITDRKLNRYFRQPNFLNMFSGDSVLARLEAYGHIAMFPDPAEGLFSVVWIAAEHLGTVAYEQVMAFVHKRYRLVSNQSIAKYCPAYRVLNPASRKEVLKALSDNQVIARREIAMARGRSKWAWIAIQESPKGSEACKRAGLWGK